MSFETSLQNKLKTIFGVPKVSFDLPSESKEQRCLFISVNQVKTNTNTRLSHFKVEGSILMYMQSNQLPFGYFARRIAAANANLTEDFFFYNFENEKFYQNLVERRCDFVYLHTHEDTAKDLGELTSLEIED